MTRFLFLYDTNYLQPEHIDGNRDMLELEEVGPAGSKSNGQRGESPKKVGSSVPMSNTNGFLHLQTGESLSVRKQGLVDNIDAWAMWISPPVFIVFNCIYWVAYRHVDT